jgi:GNAT superfamily N-acetyltransferase
VALLEAHRYEPRWQEWMLEIELAREPDAPLLPPGHLIRDLRLGRDERAAYDVIETAFGEWPGREPETFDDWAAVTVRRPGFSPDRMALAIFGEEVVGAMLMVDDEGEGWVDRLAVARNHRGRGVGRALLQHAFVATWRRGGHRCALGTDSRTGARAFYERAGMHVKRSFTEYSRQL